MTQQRRRASSVTTRALALGVSVVLWVSGCSGGSATPSESSGRPGGADPTPSLATADELAALKKQAGIEPCPATEPGARSVNGGLPDVTLPCLGGGQPVQLSGLRGRPMVVNVWAQWCGPCREEIPLFQRLHERSGARLQLVGIDLEDPQEARALAFAAEVGMTYPQLQDLDRAVLDALRLRGIPVTIFVEADGRIAGVHPAPVTSAAELSQLVAEHLGISA